MPSDPSRAFTCDVDAGRHTVVVNKTIGDEFVDLKVDY
jgi:hypothetical protein